MSSNRSGRRVAVTGMGCVSALGQGLDATWAALVSGQQGITRIDRRVGDSELHKYAGPAAPAVALDPKALEARTAPRVLAHMDPLAAFSVIAAHEALEDAGLVGDAVLEQKTAIVWGAGSGGNATLEESYARSFLKSATTVHPLTIPKQMISAPASHISMLFGVQGSAFMVASACASYGHAITEGMHMVRSGRYDVAIVGGGEAALTYGSWLGWLALKAMSDDTCRPFSIDRKGMVLGEGAAGLILEDYDRAKARGAKIYAELAGAGASSDAYHITMPHGRGAESALRLAHEDAGVPLDTRVLVSSHGTGTPLNDKIETAAMKAVYGEALGRDLVIATKSSHGHLIGGAAALELVTGILALDKRVAPAILNYQGADPECDAPLALETRDIDYDVLVSNSFAFGGLNSVLIARRA